MSKKYQEINKKINDLIKSVEVSSSVPTEGSFESEGIGDGQHIIYSEKSKTDLENITDRFWRQDSEVYETRSRENIKNQIKNLIRSCIYLNQPSDNSKIERIFKNLLSLPPNECGVFRPLFGARLSSELPIDLGMFTIYDCSKHQSLIYSKYPLIRQKEYWEELLLCSENNILIHVSIIGRDSERIQERAEELFFEFDNIVRYMLSEGNLRFIYFNRDERFDISVFHHYQRSIYQSLILSTSTDMCYRGLNIRGAGQLFDMAHPVFTDQSQGHDIIWKIHANLNRSEINNRIITAVEWIGKSLRDTDLARSFVQVIFALESLLTFQQKGILVSPSIASQISEFVAFILGKDYESYLYLEKKVKRFYEIRSSIVHSGSSTIEKMDYIESIYLVQSLIYQLTTHDELSNFQSIKQLQEWVNKKKYNY